MSCNCGRTRDVVTSVQAQADMDARASQDAAMNAEIMQASAAAAIANTGWYLAPDTQVSPAEVAK